MRAGLRIDPTYLHGHFDLVRYHCANSASATALQVLKEAFADAGTGSIDPLFLANRPEDLRNKLQSFLRQDGEFTRLCSSILVELRELAGQ